MQHNPKHILAIALFWLGLGQLACAQSLPTVTDLDLSVAQVQDTSGIPITGEYTLEVSFTLPGADSLSWHQLSVRILDSGGSFISPEKQLPIQVKNYYREGVTFIRQLDKVYLDFGELQLGGAGPHTLSAEIGLNAQGVSSTLHASVSETVN